MNLRQKLTIDWPCALGDWLWAVLVMGPALFLDRLTWRSALRLIIQLAVLYLILLLIQHALPMVIRFAAEISARELGFLFTLDTTIYWEACAVFTLLAARGLSRQMLGATSRFLAHRIGALIPRLPRFGRRARRTRPAVRHLPDRGEDEAAWAFA